MRKVLFAALIWIGINSTALVAAPVPTVKFDPPMVSAQSASLDEFWKCLLAWTRSASPRAASEMDQELKRILGEKGWAGLDTKKPIGAYCYLKPKLENSSVFFAFPITKKADALDLLERLQFGAEEEKNNEGLYRIRKRNFFPDELAVRLRFKGDIAYLGINVDPEEMETAKLLPPRAWMDEKDLAPLAVRYHFGTAPKEAKEYVETQMLQPLKKARDELAANPPNGMPLSYPPFAGELLSWCDRNLNASCRDGETLSVRFENDAKSGELSIEARLTPKAKTKYAEEIAKWKGAEGRFQQLATKDSVAGWGIQASLLPVPFVSTGGAFFAELIKMGGQGADPNFVPSLDELAIGVQKLATAGKLDFGAAIQSPNKDGAHTAIVAVGFPEPAALEKALRKYIENSDELKKQVAFDAEKIEKISVHTIDLPDAPPSVIATFGKKPMIRVAFGADAVYAAFGPDGLAEIGNALKLKVAECKVSEMKVHPKKGLAFINSLAKDPEVLRMFKRILGDGDAFKTQWTADARGGSDFVVRYTQLKLGLVSMWGGIRDHDSEDFPEAVPIKPAK